MCYNLGGYFYACLFCIFAQINCMKLIKFFLARWQSKSPVAYKILTDIAVIVASLLGLFMWVHSIEPQLFQSAIWVKLYEVAPTAISFLAGIGLVAKTTTTDPALLTDDLVNSITDLNNLKKKM